MGQGIDDHMADYIKKCFIKARNHFATILSPHHQLPATYPNWMEYFFDYRRITEGGGPVPIPYGGCRYCGKINGHHTLNENCPVYLKRKENVKRLQEVKSVARTHGKLPVEIIQID